MRFDLIVSFDLIFTPPTPSSFVTLLSFYVKQPFSESCPQRSSHTVVIQHSSPAMSSEVILCSASKLLNWVIWVCNNYLMVLSALAEKWSSGAINETQELLS